jgi:hypothetical protein
MSHCRIVLRESQVVLMEVGQTYTLQHTSERLPALMFKVVLRHGAGDK